MVGDVPRKPARIPVGIDHLVCLAGLVQSVIPEVAVAITDRVAKNFCLRVTHVQQDSISRPSRDCIARKLGALGRGCETSLDGDSHTKACR